MWKNIQDLKKEMILDLTYCSVVLWICHAAAAATRQPSDEIVICWYPPLFRLSSCYLFFSILDGLSARLGNAAHLPAE